MGAQSIRPVSQPLLPPPPPPALPLQEANQLPSTTVTLQSLCAIDRNSIRLLPSTDTSSLFYLQADYSTRREAVLTASYFAQEVLDPRTQLRVFTTNQTGAFAPREVRLAPGNRQPLPSQLLPINFGVNVQWWTFQDQTVYPVVLEVKIGDEPEQVHTSMVCFAQEAGVWKAKLLQQRLYAHDRYFVLHELFGVQRQPHPDDESSECVICMTDRKNTTVLPCRHMCLCGACANIVRSQPTSKCPICRCPVDCLLQLVVEQA